MFSVVPKLHPQRSQLTVITPSTLLNGGQLHDGDFSDIKDNGVVKCAL